MKALKIIGIILGGLIGIWLIASLLAPSTCVVERSTVINAPQQAIFDHVNSISKWKNWSYWMKLDTTQTVTYSGPDAGVGASYSWDGKQTGKGTLTVVESNPPSNLKLKLDFGPQGGGDSYWTFEPGDGGVKVTQTFKEELKFNQRVFPGLMIDKFLGSAFEEDLKSLKAYAESVPAAPAVSIEQVDAPAQWVIAVRDTAKAAELSAAFPVLYGKLNMYLAEKKVAPNGYGLAVWHKADMATDYFEFEAGLPIADSIAAGKGLRVFKLGGKALKTTYFGNYDNMQGSYAALEEHVKQNNLTMAGAPWEVYVSSPMTEPDTAKWQTDIYYPIN